MSKSPPWNMSNTCTPSLPSKRSSIRQRRSRRARLSSARYTSGALTTDHGEMDKDGRVAKPVPGPEPVI
jgi:hypothetical protein